MLCTALDIGYASHPGDCCFNLIQQTNPMAVVMLLIRANPIPSKINTSLRIAFYGVSPYSALSPYSGGMINPSV
jgi:hypothetical protein